MVDTLTQYPDHSETNNSLGYTWADRGVNLQEAEAMIQKAVRDQPDNAAFRDSLGWVYYKLGRFEDSVRELRRARGEKYGTNPIILDHLGDAQYRSGQREEAQQSWRQALMMFDPQDAAHDRELDGLDTRLQQKIDAVKDGKEPAVADVPQHQPAASPDERAAATF